METLFFFCSWLNQKIWTMTWAIFCSFSSRSVIDLYYIVLYFTDHYVCHSLYYFCDCIYMITTFHMIMHSLFFCIGYLSLRHSLTQWLPLFIPETLSGILYIYVYFSMPNSFVSFWIMNQAHDHVNVRLSLYINHGI